MKRLLAVSLLAMIGLTACENDSVTSPLAPGSQATSFAKPAVPEFEPPEECPAASCLLGPETITRETKGPIVWVGEFAEVEDQEVELVVYASSPKRTTVQAWLNDKKVLLPSAMPRAEGNEVRVPLTLTAGDVLEVRLTGKPGTQVAFWVEEVVDEEDGETEEPGIEDPGTIEPTVAYEFATSAQVALDAHKNAACEAAFPGSTIADWNDVVAAVAAGVTDAEILDSGYAFILNNGVGTFEESAGLFTLETTTYHYALSAWGPYNKDDRGSIGDDLTLTAIETAQPVLCVKISS